MSLGEVVERVSVKACLYAERGQEQQDPRRHDVCQKLGSHSPCADSLIRSWPEGKDMEEVSLGHIGKE